MKILLYCGRIGRIVVICPWRLGHHRLCLAIITLLLLSAVYRPQPGRRRWLGGRLLLKGGRGRLGPGLPLL